MTSTATCLALYLLLLAVFLGLWMIVPLAPDANGRREVFETEEENESCQEN